MRSRLLFLSLIMIFSAACTEKGKPIVQHEPDRRHDDAATVTATTDADLASMDVGHWEDNFNRAGDPLKDVLVPLAARVLDPARIRDPRSLESRATQDELVEFNRLFLRLPAADQTRSDYKDIARRYESALMTDCQGFIDGCTGLRYFHIAPTTSAVVKTLAKASAGQNPDESFRLVQIAVKLKPDGWDPELAELLLKARPTDGTAHSLLESALQTAAHKNSDPAEARRFLESIDAWKLVSDPRWNLSGSTGDALFTMLARAGMLYDGKGGLHPGLRELIRVQSAEPDGFMSKQKMLQNTKLFEPRAVGARFVGGMDELLFVLDAVYTGRISSAGGVALFAGSRHSGADLAQAVENYLRIQFLASLLESTQMAKKIFTAKVQVQDLMYYAFRETASIQRVWSTFKGRALPLRDFVIRASRQTADGAGQQARLNALFDSIDRSITLSSVYPHELVLFHMLAQKQFELTLPFSGRKIDSGDIMNYIFEGKLPPLLAYADKSRTLNEYELLYAFDMAVRTNLIQSVGIDVDYFIADTLHRLSSKGRSDINTALSRIEARFQQASSYQEFKNACEEFRSGRIFPRRFYFDEVRRSPYYGKLAEVAFEGIAAPQTTTSASEPGALPEVSMGLRYMEHQYDEALEIARLDIGNQLRIGRAMLASYESYLRLSGLGTAQITGKTSQTRKMLADLEAVRARVLDTAKKWHDDIGFCYWKSVGRDFAVRDRLLEMEKAYLRHVYALIGRLRAPGLPAAEKQAIEQSIRLSGLPGDFKGQDRISADGYFYSEFDLVARVSRYLSTGLHTETGDWPAVAPQVSIDFGQKLTLDVPAVRDSQQYFLGYTDSEQAFVDSALRVLFRQRNPYLFWLAGTSSALTSWGDTLKSMVSLNRLEREARGTSTIATAKEILDTQEEILRWVSVSAGERDLYTVLRLPSKFRPLSFDYRMLRYDLSTNRILTTWGLFDFPVKLMEAEMLGYHWDGIESGTPTTALPTRQTYFSAGRDYYTARANSDRGTTVIPFNPDLDRELDRSVGGFVRGELGAIDAFSNATLKRVQNLRSHPGADPLRFDLNMYTSYADPMLSDGLLDSFRANVDQFHQATSRCFAGPVTAVCDEFK